MRIVFPPEGVSPSGRALFSAHEGCRKTWRLIRPGKSSEASKADSVS